MKQQYSLFGKKSLRTVAIVLTSVAAAFALGVQTAGDFHPVAATEADGTLADGDFNHNGYLDIRDARIALELASGYRSPTPDELAADPNGDFTITNDDVLTILEHLERIPSTPKVSL